MDLLRSNVFVQPLFLKSCCLLFKKRYLCSACVKTCFFVFDPLYTTYLIGRLTRISRSTVTVVCISLETRSIASQPSVAVGWVKIKVWSMPHLKGLTANFKLM